MRDAIFMMGLPGAGKTTVIQREFAARADLPLGTQFIWVDCDEIKKQHPFYSNEDPSKLHEWSATLSIEQFWQAIAIAKNVDVLIVVDGTGAKPEFLTRIKEAKSAGFRVVIFYVDTPFDTCARRLQERERKVPPTLLHEKLRGIAVNWPGILALADEIITFDGISGNRTFLANLKFMRGNIRAANASAAY